MRAEAALLDSFTERILGKMLIVIAFEIVSIAVYYKLSEWLLTKYTSGGG